MARWQRKARSVVAIFGVLFAIFVARQLRPRDPPPPSVPVARSDPAGIAEVTAGKLEKFKGSRRGVSVDSAKQILYPDGTSKLLGVKMVTDERNGARTFTITGREGRVGSKDTSIVLDGDVRFEGSDGMTALTEHATYSDADGIVRAPGAVRFTRGRVHGNGVGMTWDKALDVMTILDQAVVQIAADDNGAGAADVTAGSAAFARKDKFIRFEKAVRIQRGGQIIESNSAVLFLSADEKRVETVELHDQARITTEKAAPGALQGLNGREMNLRYAADGESLEHALVSGDAVIQVAGAAGKVGRRIAAATIDVTLAPDGVTPTALVGREAVQLTFPPEPGSAGRTINAANLEARGEPGKGLTRARFTGNVQYREKASDSATTRAASSAALDMGLKNGMSAIDQANFSHGVRFEEGTMAALAAAAIYDVDKGTLALSGSEPGAVVPHMVNEKIVVDAAAIDVTLAGPKVKASGNVRSELRPAPPPKPGGPPSDVKMPSMLKQDLPVNVLADSLDYDGTTAKSTYTGAARLFQGDTSIKGGAIVIDNKGGNLGASGGVLSTTVLERSNAEKKMERQQSIAKAKDMAYLDSERRLTYTGDAHMSGPEGDMTAERIVLYLKEGGEELERAEAYEGLTLREQNRETKGEKMIYTTANETYVVTGAPVTIVDQCQRETVGKTLTFNKGTDSIVVDGNSQIRTQTKGGNSKCTS